MRSGGPGTKFTFQAAYRSNLHILKSIAIQNLEPGIRLFVLDSIRAREVQGRRSRVLPRKEIRPMKGSGIPLVVVITGFLLVPGSAHAQSASTGSIAGVARDTTGAVLPGVTVEAASPALIEKVRTVVTDQEGQYKILELRPGTYTVTFTLTGFATVKREGIQLTTGFTAAVNADMRVGSLEETITVSGASPVVDTQNVRTQNVLSRDVLDALPSAKSVPALGALTVGVSPTGTGGSGQDVGGNKGEQYAGLVVHGSRQQDGRFLYDGMRFNMTVTDVLAGAAGAGQ